MCCGLLYAETKFFSTGSLVNFSLTKPGTDNSNTFSQYRINSIVPYENGYLMKCTNINDNYSLELFIFKSFSFYTRSLQPDGITYYKCTITSISPNVIAFNEEEFTKN